MSVPDTKRIEQSEHATQAWDKLAEQVDALIAAWESDEHPPGLAQFVTADTGKIRPIILAELIKVDLEFRWHQKRDPKKVEDYAVEFPELATDGKLPGDLIYEEYHIRRQAGDPVKPDEYFQRFPQQKTQLQRLLGLEEPDMTTTLCGGRKKNTLSVGQKIDDFDLLTTLGEGAFAQVFLARQISMQRIVALKVSADKGTESQTLAMLDHPHIVRVYDQRVLKEKKLRVMYMQHIPGGTLQAVVERVKKTPLGERTGKVLLAAVDAALEKQGESPPMESSLRRRLENSSWGEAVCWLGARLAAGLDYAHQRGVLHRDVKPANILLTAEASPKLVDFNISYSSKVEGSTPAAYFGGSLAYMSPEQLEAADSNHDRQPDSLDGRSDLYSLGIILWELLIGERPFQDSMVPNNWSATLQQLTERRKNGVSTEAIAKLPKNLPPGMIPTLLNALRPNAEDRPTSAGAFSKQLDLCLQPEVQRLLLPARGKFVDLLKKYPLGVLIVCALAANGILSYFNTSYNWVQIVRRVPEAWSFFWDAQVPTVNIVCYTIGLTIGISITLPILRALRFAQNKHDFPTERLPEFRDYSAKIGERITRLSILLWILTGVAFPLWLKFYVGNTSQLHWTHFLHFTASQVVCGLIASTQVYFSCTPYSLRYIYPRFVRPEAPASDNDFQSLATLARQSGRYLILACVAPIIAIILVVSIPEAIATAGDVASAPALTDDASLPWFVFLFDLWTTKSLMLMLAFLGLLGTVLSLWMNKSIQSDIAALATALDPTRSGRETDSFDTTWTRSR